MSYKLFILRSAKKELSTLPVIAYQRVKAVITGLGDNPRARNCRKLSGREGWRVRAGPYRIVYEIDDSSHTVTVLHIGHRRDVYR